MSNREAHNSSNQENTQTALLQALLQQMQFQNTAFTTMAEQQTRTSQQLMETHSAMVMHMIKTYHPPNSQLNPSQRPAFIPGPAMPSQYAKPAESYFQDTRQHLRHNAVPRQGYQTQPPLVHVQQMPQQPPLVRQMPMQPQPGHQMPWQPPPVHQMHMQPPAYLGRHYEQPNIGRHYEQPRQSSRGEYMYPAGRGYNQDRLPEKHCPQTDSAPDRRQAEQTRRSAATMFGDRLASARQQDPNSEQRGPREARQHTATGTDQIQADQTVTRPKSIQGRNLHSLHKLVSDMKGQDQTRNQSKDSITKASHNTGQKSMDPERSTQKGAMNTVPSAARTAPSPAQPSPKKAPFSLPRDAYVLSDHLTEDTNSQNMLHTESGNTAEDPNRQTRQQPESENNSNNSHPSLNIQPSLNQQSKNYQAGLTNNSR